MSSRIDLLEIGEIVKPHGIRGRLKVHSFAQSDDLLYSLTEVFIKKGEDKPRLFPLRSCRIRGNCFYLEMEGVESIEQAAELVGASVLIPSGMLEKLPEGEYYWQELIGLEIVTEEGLPLGRLESIFPTGSNDVYVCRGEGREILLPAIEEVVKKIDPEKGVMVVRLLEGL